MSSDLVSLLNHHIKLDGLITLCFTFHQLFSASLFIGKLLSLNKLLIGLYIHLDYPITLGSRNIIN